MEFLELVKKSRSYRGFSQTERLTREQIEQLIDCARFAPASVNYQPFKYYISCDDETNNSIQVQTAWARRLVREWKLPLPGHCPTAFIIICYDKTVAPEFTLDRFKTDVGIVAQTMLLAATSMGFGGCMIGNFSPAKIAETLALSENLEPALIVALGKPDEEVVLTEAVNGDIGYTRDANNVTYVPKRPLDEIIIK